MYLQQSWNYQGLQKFKILYCSTVRSELQASAIQNLERLGSTKIAKTYMNYCENSDKARNVKPEIRQIRGGFLSIS